MAHDGGSPSSTGELPARVAHFRITGSLGRGGMGVVYRAEDETLRRTVALKLLPDAGGSEERRQRFLREARSAAAITHPNVATIYQVGEADGRVFIAMELVEGENLRQRMARGLIDLATAKDLAAQIADGLAAAHDKGIVHRDLKPENVVITPSGVVKLLDFGLAKVGVERPESGTTAAALAKTETVVTSDEGRVMGTPEYMSPEQALGEALDLRSDVFSFGIVLYEMLSGTRPFGGTTTGSILVAIARDAPAPLRQKAPEVDEATEAVVTRCLAKAAAERFRSAREVVAALSGQTSPRATTVSHGQVTPASSTDGGRGSGTKLVVALVLAALAAATLGIGLQATRRTTPATTPVAPASSPVAPSGESMSHSSNPEAQRLFDLAMRAFHDGTLQDVPLLQKAVELDPNFGGAYVRLWYLGTGGFEDSLGARSFVREHADEYHRKVVALDATLSPRDRAFLDWLEEPTPEGTLPKLDAYLARYPDDDWARVALIPFRPGSLDVAMARDPTLVPLLLFKAYELQQDGRVDDEMKLVGQCLAVMPHALQCMALRAGVLDQKGDCSAAESAVRSWLELQPDSLVAPPLLAGILAAEGAPSAAVREALGSNARSAVGDGQMIFDALVPVLDGDFSTTIALAREAARRVPSTAPEQDHFLPAATLIQAATEAGDMAGAARAAADYLSRRQAWKDPLPYRTAFFIGAAARGGLLSRAQADRQLDAVYGALVKEGVPSEEAWAMVYAYAAETPAEASAAVARLDTMDAATPKGWRGATSRTFFLAGRSAEARHLAEDNVQSCSSVLLVSRNVLHSHLYLGQLDEQSGDKPSACAHYAKVLERWGHAIPRSLTADEARVHATKLGCPSVGAR